MCGIAGAFSTQKTSDRSILERMLNRMIHRGPDSAGYFTDGPFAAGMRRLRIIDLETGDQPLFNRDRTVALLYNGEIYNSPELRKKLEAKGTRFRTHSDGEVICHLYDQYGEECFSYLDGMFAAALWDSKKSKLVLARDIPGEKPLYYGNIPGGLAFASDVASLALHPGLDLGLNLQSVWNFPTFSWVPEPSTIYKGIHALGPGQILTIDSSGRRLLNISNRFDDSQITDSSTDEEVIAAVRSAVICSVKSRLLSDVPVGSFLSGGLDSSIIASIAAKEISGLKTFTVGFEDSEDLYHGHADESAQALEYARILGTDHHNIRVTAKDFRDLLDPFIHFAGHPFAISSGLGILAISKAAREQGIKVLLSGDGADEAFGGYSWYFHLPAQAGQQATATDDISFQSLNLSAEEKASIISQYQGPLQAWAWHYYASELDKERLFSSDLRAATTSSVDCIGKYQPRNGVWTPEEFIRQDRKFYFVNEMLQKVDRYTMASSIEGRPPFASPRIAALADRLKFRHCVRKDRLKWVLREAFAKDLPEEIISRPKHGFNVPLDLWFRTEWLDLVDETFSPTSTLSRLGLITPESGAYARELIFGRKKIIGQTILGMVVLNRWLGSEFRGTV